MRVLVLGLTAALAACGSNYQPEVPKAQAATSPNGPTETAVFAGGCFWCTEADFEKVPGVVAAVSGYTGGTTSEPTYKQVTAGGTGHYEAVQVTYDPSRVTYAQLAEYYFRTVDPTDPNGQFCDRGESYRTAIFVAGPEQRKAAEAALEGAQKALWSEIVTPVLPASRFWEAEGYHQDYYKKNSLKYSYYRTRCGRDARLAEVWGKSKKTS
jgi:peptide-methionine (S)-S-oxide reductase